MISFQASLPLLNIPEPSLERCDLLVSCPKPFSVLGLAPLSFSLQVHDLLLECADLFIVLCHARMAQRSKLDLLAPRGELKSAEALLEVAKGRSNCCKDHDLRGAAQ